MDLNAINCLKCFSFDIVVTVINEQIKSLATRVWHITLPVITQSVRHSRLQIMVNPHETNAKAEPHCRAKFSSTWFEGLLTTFGDFFEAMSLSLSLGVPTP